MRLGMGLGLGNLLSGQPLTGFPNDFSFNFDGSNDYLDTGNSFSSIFTESFSISAWIKPNDGQPSGAEGILGTITNTGWTGYIEFKVTTAGKLSFFIGTPTAKELEAESTVVFSNGTVDWSHVAVVFSKSSATAGTITLYFNGASVGSGSSPDTGWNLDNYVNNYALFIGATNQADTATQLYNGNIDEVALWDTALSADDVAKIASKPVDFSKASTYATDRTSNLKLWLRAGDKVLPESDTSIARSDFYTDFDGTNDVVLIEDNSSFDFGTNDYTMMAWAKTSSSTYQAIVGQGQTGTNPLKLIYIDNNGYFKGAIEDSSANSVDSSGDGGIWDDGNWHHFVIVFKYGDKMYRYVDGKNVGTNDSISSVGSTDSSVKFSIGAFFGGVTYSTLLFNGQISNISVYQTALDSQTIKQFAKSRYTPMRDNRFSVVDFDGSDDRITTNVNSTLTDSTYIFWAKATETGANKGVFGHGGDQAGAFSFNWSSNRPLLYLGGSRYRFWNDTSAQDDGVWHCWAVVLDADDMTGCKLYVDGVEQTVNSTSNSGDYVSYSTGLTIGSDSVNYAECSIAQFAVYSDLKDSDFIYAQWSKGITANFLSDTNLIAYYRMGDDTSASYPTIADSSSNSNDGTIANGASDDIVQQMVAGYDMGAFESTGEELGAERVLEPSFASSTGWATDYFGTGWSITGNKLVSDGSQSAGSNASADIDTSSGFYKVVITVDSISSGTIRPNLENWGSYISTSGTHTQFFTLTGNNDLTIQASADFVGSISFVSVKEVLQSADLSDTYPAIIDVNEPVLGAELITSNTTSEWAQYGSGGSEANTANGVALTAGSDTRNAYRTVSGLTDGKLYKLNVDAYYSGSSDTVKIEIIAGSGSLFTPALTTTSTNYIIYFVKNSGTMYILGNGFNNGNVLYVENLTVKEIQGNVGTMTNQDSADLVYSSVLPDQSFLTGVNSAYNFIDLDGSDQYIDAGALDSALEPPLSISMWVKGDAQSNKTLIQDNNVESGILYTRAGNEISLYTSAGDKSYSYTLDNTWAHIVMTQASSAKPLVYVNGDLLSDGSQDFAPNPSFSNIRIGGDYGEFEGSIGQTAIWNKVLSSIEVGAIYTLGRHGNLLDSYSDNLKGYWGMSALDASTGLSDSISTIYDRSGNSNHGTPQNADAGDLKSPPNAQPEGYSKQDTNRSTTTP